MDLLQMGWVSTFVFRNCGEEVRGMCGMCGHSKHTHVSSNIPGY